MSTNKIIVVVGAVFLALVAVIGITSGMQTEGKEEGKQAESTPTVLTGEELYKKSCITCHANEATVVKQLENYKTEEEKRDILVNGIGGMPGVVDEEEATKILQYLETVK